MSSDMGFVLVDSPVPCLGTDCRNGIPHALFASAKHEDVLLVISYRDFYRKTGDPSDYVELVSAINGLDLPDRDAEQ